MTMTIVVTRNAPERSRGFLASCMCEIAPGVYTGPRMSAAVRDRVWKVLEEWFDAAADQSFLMSWPDEGLPGGQEVRSLGSPRIDLVQVDGCYLARREVSGEPSGDEAGSGAVGDSIRGGHLATVRGLRVLDLETTGLGPQAEPVEIAIVGSEGETLLSSLIKPSRPSSAVARSIHGISADELERAPSFAEIAPAASALLSGQRVFAYNANFDRTVLERAFRRAGVALPDLEWHCALDAYESARGVRCTLESACRAEGIEHTGVHRAASDALMTLRLLREIEALTTEA